VRERILTWLAFITVAIFVLAFAAGSMLLFMVAIEAAS
jgi:hypothetical protein